MVVEEIEQTPDKTSLKEALQPFTLEILTLIKDAHQQHGLRHGDYQRYRGYCSRRIRRLRKVLKLPQGDRRHFKKRDVTETHVNNPLADERYLHVPLILAERNWAYAMQLRQESNTEPRKKFHMIRKLRKACNYALQLDELCKLQRCDARTKLETQAYVAWIHGMLHFELRLWSTAGENLKKAQVVYEKLAAALPEDQQTPYKQRIDELAPNIRYCSYNTGEDKSVNLPELRSMGILENLDEFLIQSAEKAQVLHEVDWYDVKVPIRIEKVQLFLQSLGHFDESLAHAENDSKRVQILENMFIDLRDVISVTRGETKPDDKDGQLLLAYLLSIRIERTIQRNLLLIAQTRKSQDVVRLLDIIVQQMNELGQLEPLLNNARVQDDFADRLFAFRTLRCFYVAKSYAGQRRWTEAAGCFERALKQATRAVAAKHPKDVLDSLQNVIENVPTELVWIRSQAVLETENDSAPPPAASSKKTSKKPLIERLDEFHENAQYLTKSPNLVTMPPELVAIPAKPLFYDLAYNFVQFPSLDDKVEDGASKQKQASGISGFVKGIWSGWGGSGKSN